MKKSLTWLYRLAEFIAATMLAAMFAVFLLQIFSRYVLVTPFGWTLELSLILWVWIVFFCCAFLVREKEHVTFDILYLAVPRGPRRAMGLFACLAIVAGMAWAWLPTWDYIDWMNIRKTTTVKNPFTADKISLRTIFSIYTIFMTAVIIRYAWRFVYILRKGPTDDDHTIPNHEPDPPHLRQGKDVV